MIQKAVLDACVLYPASVRDTLLSIAAEGAFVPYWSQMIHNEWQRNLLEDRREDLTQEILNKTSDAMNTSFSGSFVNDFHHLIDEVELPDEDDRHVLANMKAISPDDFIMSLCDEFDFMIIEAVKKQRQRLKKPPKTAEELLETLKINGLTKFEAYLKDVIEEI